jgi:hypothetical protein
MSQLAINHARWARSMRDSLKNFPSRHTGAEDFTVM